jgi:LytR cell envelope-related transcriptional attenuator
MAVIVALIAAVLGFFILKSLDDDSGSAASPDSSDETTTSLGTETTVVVTTTTLNRATFQALVANASGISGSASAMSDQLAAVGYRMLEPTNVVPGFGPLSVTVVYYQPGFELQGADVATTLGLGSAQPMPTPKPVTDTDFAGATVLVALGTDLAGQPLPGSAGATTTTLPSTVSSVEGSPNSESTTG